MRKHELSVIPNLTRRTYTFSANLSTAVQSTSLSRQARPAQKRIKISGWTMCAVKAQKLVFCTATTANLDRPTVR
jgi:hypothetical protein